MCSPFTRLVALFCTFSMVSMSFNCQHGDYRVSVVVAAAYAEYGHKSISTKQMAWPYYHPMHSRSKNDAVHTTDHVHTSIRKH